MFANVLVGFGGWLLQRIGGELFRKAAVFITMNIVLQYLSSWLMSQIVQGISVANGGSAVGGLFATFAPLVLYVMDICWVIPGVYLILNVKLWRMSGRLTVRAATAG